MAKPNTTIKTDKYGPYVRTGGYLFRPAQQGTKFNEGDPVRARHIGGSVHAQVDDELWVSHGSYLNTEGKRLPSEQVWKEKK